MSKIPSIQELQESHLKEAKKLYKNPRIQHLLMKLHLHNNFSFFERHTSFFKTWLNDTDPCQDCPGLSNCSQPLKGKYRSLELIDGCLTQQFKSCQYELQKENLHTYTYLYQYSDMKEDDMVLQSEQLLNSKESNEYALAMTRALQSMKWSKGLYLYGKPGCGKTWMMQALANRYVQRLNIPVSFINLPQTVLACKLNRYQINKILKAIRNSKVVFLDDIGAEAVTKWSRDEIVLPILTLCFKQQKKVYFTSNYDPSLLEEVYSLDTSPENRQKASYLITNIQTLSNPMILPGDSRRYT